MKIIILGGGTAGWMTASLLHHAWNRQNAEITLIESPEIATIGVGEGSTPALKSFFDKLKIPEVEWMPRCNATYKCGITFQNWSGRNEYPSYFHPFPSHIDGNTINVFSHNIHVRRNRGNALTQPDRYFLSAKLAHQGLAPKESESFPFEITYGYHFDAGLLAEFLRERAIVAGVRHLQAKITGATRDNSGKLTEVIAEDSQTFAADFFIDCSGFAGFLIQQQLQVPFHSFKENLFNDAAVAMPSSIGEKIPTHTRSIALRHGWAWEIPLTNRYGNGYVYSRDYCSENEAEEELRRHLNLLEADIPVRHLRMKVGRLDQHWSHNCLAVGLSQGFIEPLEATALMLVQYTIENFILAFEKGNFTDANQPTFNNIINSQFEGIRDYIVSHYKTSNRMDTPYWCDNSANQKFSPSLQQVFHCWMSGKNLSEEIQKQGIGKYYTDISWYCLLAGMGTFPSLEGQPNSAKSQYDNAQVDEFLRRCALNFPDHRQYLEQQEKKTRLQASGNNS